MTDRNFLISGFNLSADALCCPDIRRQQGCPESEVHPSMSNDNSTPSLTKFFASQSPAYLRPLVAKKNEKLPIGVVLARRTECTHEFVVRDAVYQHVRQLFVNDAVLCGEPGDETDRPHLPHRRRIEADLVNAVRNIARRVRYLFAEQRIDI
jgi:hypothetical protein